VDDFISAEEALAAFHRVAETIGAGDLHRCTPCPAWDIETLAEHLIDTISRVAAAAGIPAAAAAAGSIDQRIQRLTQPILNEWSCRGLAGDIFFSGRTLPAQLALGILSLELVVHGWDLGVAMHRPIRISDAHAAYVLGLARRTLTEESRAVAGFDPPVPMPASAAALDRLVAFTGRDPQQQIQERAVPQHSCTTATRD
jgi:uncharacterized protein (TIGR03086 family)